MAVEKICMRGFNSKAYLSELGGAMVAYIGTLFGVVGSRPHTDRMWVEVLPALPLLLAFFVIIRHYRRMDEFYQRVHAQAFALGAMVVGVGIMIWGFAENAGAPALSTMWVTPALLGAWGLCLPIIMRRY